MQSDSTEANQIQQKQTTPSELLVITFNLLKTQEKLHVHCVIGSGFPSIWLKN